HAETNEATAGDLAEFTHREPILGGPVGQDRSANRKTHSRGDQRQETGDENCQPVLRWGRSDGVIHRISLQRPRERRRIRWPNEAMPNRSTRQRLSIRAASLTEANP